MTRQLPTPVCEDCGTRLSWLADEDEDAAPSCWQHDGKCLCLMCYQAQYDHYYDDDNLVDDDDVIVDECACWEYYDWLRENFGEEYGGEA